MFLILKLFFVSFEIVFISKLVFDSRKDFWKIFLISFKIMFTFKLIFDSGKDF